MSQPNPSQPHQSANQQIIQISNTAPEGQNITTTIVVTERVISQPMQGNSEQLEIQNNLLDDVKNDLAPFFGRMQINNSVQQINNVSNQALKSSRVVLQTGGEQRSIHLSPIKLGQRNSAEKASPSLRNSIQKSNQKAGTQQLTIQVNSNHGVNISVPFDNSLILNNVNMITTEQVQRGLAEQNEILQRMKQRIYGHTVEPQPIDNPTSYVSPMKQKQQTKVDSADVSFARQKQRSIVKLNYHQKNRTTLVSQQINQIIKTNQALNQKRVSKLYLQGYKKIPSVNDLKGQFRPIRQQDNEDVPFNLPSKLSLNEESILQDMIFRAIDGKSQWTNNPNHELILKAQKYFQSQMKKCKINQSLKKVKQSTSYYQSSMKELEQESYNDQRLLANINHEIETHLREIKQMEEKIHSDKLEIKAEGKKLNDRKKQICRFLKVKDFKLFGKEQIVNISKVENLDYFLEFNLNDKLIGKLRKRTDKAFADLVINPTFSSQQMDLRNQVYLTQKMRVSAIRSAFIEEYPACKNNPLHLLLCLSNLNIFFDQLESQLQHAYLKLIVKSLELSESCEDLKLIVQSPSRINVQIRIQLARHNWSNYIQIKCRQQQGLVNSILQQSKDTYCQRLRKILNLICSKMN